jgi:metal-sulfur cluster biosynthetic enzyme
MLSKETILDSIKSVEDPEIGLSVVDLGLIYDVAITDDGEIDVIMTLTTPGCPYGPILVSQVEEKIKGLEGVTKAIVTLVWDPPWNPAEMASEKARDALGIW